MRVVREEDMLPNSPDPVVNEAYEWYKEALKAMYNNPGQWVEVSDETNFHRSRLHQEKFKLFNEGSGDYQTEFRYPEGSRCLMYGRAPKQSAIKRWWNK